MIKAIGFDVGHTLINYRNPLNWRTLYRPALEQAAQGCGISLSDEMAVSAIEILLKYNTRVNYREYEVSADTIFSEILVQWQLCLDMDTLKTGFYSFFQAEAAPYPDTEDTLLALRQAGIKIGVLTDVAYGMDNKFSLRDITVLSDLIDITLTSVDVGYRKPNSAGFQKLMTELQVSPDEMMYVGDEQKDIVGANQLGITSVLVNRTDTVLNYGQTHTIRSLQEILRIIYTGGQKD